MSAGNNNLSNWRGKLWCYAPLILWIGVIFVLSSNQGSMSNTSRIIRPLLLWLFPHISEENLLIVHGYIRKSAHITVYSILAILAARSFLLAQNIRIKNYWFVSALLTVVLVSSLDEFNQSFLASRTGTIYDVFLDSISGLVILLILWLANRVFFAKN